ncbi:ADIPOR-like receptor SPBC12C2.09c [Erysiphe neolycopersici]|uniref:ADIPOR-like receptor SPBC12C2.09c n=1 Tax=Erysiphe neolycopersici TaxID=212602 RepID=A0A420HK18_9PEZI|nr:ADIPOR-like receptor SPBC12C2.09c [Erysiphe neolycopersici]
METDRNKSNAIADTISKTTATSVKSSSLTVTWEKLPAWQQDNHYIRTGYRPASASFLKSFASLGYLHNESVNIYSHLLGAFFFTVLGSLIYYFMIILHFHSSHYSYYPDLIMKAKKTFFSVSTAYGSSDAIDTAATLATFTSSPEEVRVFSCFFAGAISCLAISGTYHAISNHSPTVARWGNKMDYVGIICLIVGSFIPSIFYGFYCHPVLQRLYWNMIFTLGLACTAVTIFDRFRTPVWRPYRATMFIAMGLSALFPVIHGLKIYGFHTMRSRIGLVGLVFEGIFYIMGASLYAARWPERSKPGFFDVWGSSHQIFHILVLVAAGFHFYSLLTAYKYHHHVIGATCVS